MCESDCILLLDVLAKMQISCHFSKLCGTKLYYASFFSLVLQINMQEGWPLLHI